MADHSQENHWSMLGPGWMQSDSSGPVWPFQPHPPCPYSSHDLLSQVHSPFSFPWQSTLEIYISVAFPGQSLSLPSTLLSCFNTQAQSSFLGSSLSAPPPSNPWPVPYFSNLLFNFLAGFLDMPCHLFAHWSPVQLSPLARSVPGSVSNINILLPLPLSPQNVMICSQSPSLTSVEPVPSLPVCLSS